MKRRILTPKEALNRAAALCAKCEQCSPDIIKKLSSWGISASDSAKIINRLEELRFLDDERFANAYAHDKLMFSGWGKMKIAQGLWAKRIPRGLIEKALDGLDMDEYAQVANRVIAAKVRLSPELLDSYEGWTKLLRFGAGRGFGVTLVSSIISRLKKDREDE